MATKTEEPQELEPLSDAEVGLVLAKHINVSDLMWKQKYGELIPLRMMTDQHLRNCALMLIGMSHQEYNAPEELKIRWLTALRLEWEKRKGERHASFKKNS